MREYDYFHFGTKHKSSAECVAWLETWGVPAEDCKVKIEDGRDILYPCDISIRTRRGRVTVRDVEAAIEQVGGWPHYTHIIEVDYDHKDIESAPMAMCIVIDDRASRSGAIYKTAYDYTSACKKCGIGRVQTGPLVAMVAKKRGDRRLIQTRDADWLMHRECAEHLCAAVPEARTQLAMLSEKSHAASADYVQIRVTHELPGMLLEPSGVVIESNNPFYCGLCKRGGYFGGGPIVRPTYRRDDLRNITLLPFMVTPEKESYSDLSGKMAEGYEYVSPGWLMARTDVALALFEMSIQNLRVVPVGIVE